MYAKSTRSIFFVCALFLCTGAIGSDCNISLPEKAHIPEAFPARQEYIWAGSTEFAAYASINGVWTGLGPNHNYRNKWWWWREDHKAGSDRGPELVITASRLDKPAPFVKNTQAKDGYANDWDSIIVLMEFPAPGCWEMTGSSHDHELKFIFKVGEDDSGT